jgi:hypothetical protein
MSRSVHFRLVYLAEKRLRMTFLVDRSCVDDVDHFGQSAYATYNAFSTATYFGTCLSTLFIGHSVFQEKGSRKTDLGDHRQPK